MEAAQAGHDLSELERKIIDELQPEPRSMRALMQATGNDASTEITHLALSRLERLGYVETLDRGNPDNPLVALRPQNGPDVPTEAPPAPLSERLGEILEAVVNRAGARFPNGHLRKTPDADTATAIAQLAQGTLALQALERHAGPPSTALEGAAGALRRVALMLDGVKEWHGRLTPAEGGVGDAFETTAPFGTYRIVPDGFEDLDPARLRHLADQLTGS